MSRYLAIIVLLCIHCTIEARDSTKFANRIRLKVSVLDEGVMIPLYPHVISNRIHPGLQCGFEYYYTKHEYRQFFQTANAGFFIHPEYEHGIYMNSEVGYRYILPFGLSIDGLLGIGYLHTISAKKEYEQDDNGVYKEIRSFGRPHFLSDATLSLGYDFSKKSKIIIHPFVSYQFMIEYPWSRGEYGLSPILPRTNLHLGVLFTLHFKHQIKP